MDQPAEASKCCCICGANDAGARAYIFYYGKQTGERTEIHYPEKITTKTYAVGGAYTNYICRECIRRDHIGTVRTGLILFAIVAVLSVVLKLTVRYEGYPAYFIIPEIIAALVALGGGIGVRDIRKKGLDGSTDETGSRLLMRAKRKEISAHGYDRLWTPKEFARLQVGGGR